MLNHGKLMQDFTCGLDKVVDLYNSEVIMPFEGIQAKYGIPNKHFINICK